MTRKSKFKLAIASTLILAIAFCAVSGVRVSVQPNAAHADTPTSDKYDGDCTGHETAGRCADKCPGDTSEGTYYLQGYDKETGAAVCRLEYFNACPYADSIPATDPLCAKLQEQQTTSDPQPVTTSTPVEAAVPSKSCKGN